MRIAAFLVLPVCVRVGDEGDVSLAWMHSRMRWAGHKVETQSGAGRETRRGQDLLVLVRLCGATRLARVLLRKL